MRVALALVVLAGCAEGRAAPSRKDCEAVLAHLVVLERDSTPVMCRYHPDCGGEDNATFLQTCPKVLSRRELGCYQRATTVSGADACLDRVVLAERIETGVVEDDDRGYGGHGFDETALWGGPKSPVQRGLAKLRTLRDDACACTDAACKTRVQDRLSQLFSLFEGAEQQASQAEKDEGERLFRQYQACLDRITDPITPPSYYP